MKFWQKAFIGILIVFIVSVNVCLLLVSRYSYAQNLASDKDRAKGEYHFIQGSVRDALNNLYYRSQNKPGRAAVEALMRVYADYYAKQNVTLELWQGDTLLFANTPTEQGKRTETQIPTDQNVRMEQRSVGSSHYLYVSGEVNASDEQYSLVYVRDLFQLYNTQHNLTRFVILVSVATELVLSLVLVLLLRTLTRPIRDLEKATKEIAQGVYDRRVVVSGKDEFYDLAEHFNKMAESIEEKIEALDKTAQEKQNLVDNLAHELRTPLTTIRGYAEYLQSAHAREEDRIIASEYILSETKRMQNLAFKLLDLALLRNAPLDSKIFNSMDLLQEVETSLSRKIAEKDITLELRCELENMAGDFVLLQSLLVNLVDNAIKASPAGARIQLSAYRQQNVPVLELKDYGSGMSADQTLRVVEPFYRVDKARTRSTGGVGLGLSLCAQIAKLHGAELNISSLPNKGTTVLVRFTTPLQLDENTETSVEV